MRLERFNNNVRELDKPDNARHNSGNGTHNVNFDRYPLFD